MKEWISQEKTILFSFLENTKYFKNHKEIKKALAHQQITVNHKCVTQFNHPIQTFDTIGFSKEYTGSSFPILYEDKYIIVVYKKEGLLTIGTEQEKEKTLYHMVLEYVKQKNKNGKVFIVHRLDKDTSGILVFAKSEKIKQLFQKNWNECVLERGYIAVVEGNFKESKGTLISYLIEGSNHMVYTTKNKKEGKEAITHYRVLKQNHSYSLVEIRLETGRKNQIRVQMKEIGHPLVGDTKYGTGKGSIKRLALHAYRFGFYHPVTHKKMFFEKEVPKSFYRLVSKGGK